MRDWMRPSELARETGVSTSTLRHYEKTGVLPKPTRNPNGYRNYPLVSVARVRLVQRALALGFTLRELSDILAVKDAGGRPCGRVRDLAAEKIRIVDARIGELQQLKKQMTAMVRAWDERLDRTSSNQRAYLLETLAGKDDAP